MALRRDRLTLALVVWGVLVSQVLLYPGIAELVAYLGASPALDAGMWFLVSEFAAFVAFAGVWGVVSDAAGRRVPFIVVGAVGGATSLVGLAVAPSLGLPFESALVLRGVGGAFSIGAFSLAITMLADLSNENGRNMGAAGIAIGLGAALGSIVGGRLATVDPRYPLYAAAGVLLAAAVLAVSVEDRAPGETRTSTRRVLSRLSSRPALLVPYAFGFIDRLTAGFFALVGVFYFRDVFGLDAFGAGVVLAFFFVPFALLQYPLGSLSDRVGRFAPIVAGSVLYGVAIVGVGAAPVLELAAGLMVLVGVFGALVAPATMALVTDVVPPGERGAALGGFNLFGSLGFLTGFLVGGSVASAADYRSAFLVVGLLEVAIALVAMRAVRRLAHGVGGEDGDGTVGAAG